MEDNTITGVEAENIAGVETFNDAGPDENANDLIHASNGFQEEYWLVQTPTVVFHNCMNLRWCTLI